MSFSGVGRWAPIVHGAAVLVGILGTFLPLMRFGEAAPPSGSSFLPDTEQAVDVIEWSFWELTVPDSMQEGMWPGLTLDRIDPGVIAKGTTLVIALLVLAVAGLLTLRSRRRPGLIGRARAVSAVGAGTVVGAVAIVAAEAIAMSQPQATVDSVTWDPLALGPAVPVLIVSAVLATVAAATTLWLTPPTEADSADLDTPPMGMPVVRLPDDITPD